MSEASARQDTTTEGHGFGTAPVFLASVSTILGAIMFLRFGYAVGHVGLQGALLIILLGHLVTIPTALAIAEIATNRRVEGGGEYFIISRSFGTAIGGTIGIALYFSQALSVAFYMIAFAESFRPVAAALGTAYDPRLISMPGIVGLLVLMLTRGAKLGVSALWVVVGILALSLAFFALGGPPAGVDIGATLVGFRPDPFIVVFAIVFPAFTGMTAGVGLSGDLANPRRSIPIGVLSATITGFVVYILIVWKLANAASQEMLVTDQLVMGRIAIWGPIIPIGLACATLSSAIGSILVAPRTMQALSMDRIVDLPAVTRFLAAGKGEANEPRNATIITGILALGVALVGNVDFVARIISMFFMVTYGSLCAISFLEHFAARPSYRPSFRSKWYVSLFGAVVCVLLMFQMDPLYAILSMLIMSGMYYLIQRKREYANDLSTIFFGVMTQATRTLQIRLQKMPLSDWRPSLVMITGQTFDRSAPKHFLGWLCYRYGFGTYLHYIQGQLDADTYAQSRTVLARLISETEQAASGIYVDTIVSPSMPSALAQTLQVPGVSGMENNTIVFEFSEHDEGGVLEEVREGILLASTVGMNSLVLRHGDHHFGHHARIDVWLMWHDYRNANLMVLLAYIILGHSDWSDAELRIFAAYPEREVAERRAQLHEMIESGRIPIAEKNVRIIPTSAETDIGKLVEAQSEGADLVVLGFTDERLRHRGVSLLQRYSALRETLWVAAAESIEMH